MAAIGQSLGRAANPAARALRLMVRAPDSSETALDHRRPALDGGASSDRQIPALARPRAARAERERKHPYRSSARPLGFLGLAAELAAARRTQRRLFQAPSQPRLRRSNTCGTVGRRPSRSPCARWQRQLSALLQILEHVLKRKAFGRRRGRRANPGPTVIQGTPPICADAGLNVSPAMTMTRARPSILVLALRSASG